MRVGKKVRRREIERLFLKRLGQLEDVALVVQVRLERVVEPLAESPLQPRSALQIMTGPGDDADDAQPAGDDLAHGIAAGEDFDDVGRRKDG